MTDNVAILQGYTRHVRGSYHDQELFLLVKRDEDLDSRFRAWDMDKQEFIMVNGWLSSFTVEADYN